MKRQSCLGLLLLALLGFAPSLPSLPSNGNALAASSNRCEQQVCRSHTTGKRCRRETRRCQPDGGVTRRVEEGKNWLQEVFSDWKKTVGILLIVVLLLALFGLL